MFVAVCMVVLLASSLPFSPPAQGAELKMFVEIAEFVMSLFETSNTIAEFFLGDNPSHELVEEMKHVSQELGEILSDLEEIQAELQAIDKAINQLAGFEVEQNAWSYIPTLQNLYGTRELPTGTLYGYSQKNYGEVSPDEITTLMNKIMDGDAAYQAMLAFYDVLTPGHLPGGNSAMYYATNVAIMDYSGNPAVCDFSTSVESTNGVPIVVERPMYFDYKDAWTGGHSTVGALDPAPVFYFAEGTCRSGFEPYLCVQNPQEGDADVTITYMRGDGSTAEQSFTVAARSRYTVIVKNFLGEGDEVAYDFSARVECTNGRAIVAERPMYFNYQGAWTGGHNVIGANAPAPAFYFAEGTCRPGFDPYICVQNPQEGAADIAITYMRGDGSTAEQSFTMPGTARYTVNVKDFMGGGNDVAYDFSARVECTNGGSIVAERPMYFNYQGAWTGGHDVVGATAPAPVFYFSEGTCRSDFDSYICVQNPQEGVADVAITYMNGDGSIHEQSFSVAGNSRYTVNVKDFMGEGDDVAHDFSAKVECTSGGNIVAERPMYFNYQGAWTGGHCSQGLQTPDTSLFFAEGTVRDGFDPYLCIQNPQDSDANVKITYMKGDVRIQEQWLQVPKRSRRTVRVRDVYESNTLMDVYEKDIESLFLGDLMYQLQAIRLVCEAISTKPGYHGYANEKDFAAAVFGPGGIIDEEVDEFLTAVETYVMSKADLTSLRGGPTVTLPAGADDVFARADYLARAARGEFSGLCGRIVGSQDVVPAGSIPPITIRASGSSAPPLSPSATKAANVPAVASISGTDRVPCCYDLWNGQSINASDVWSSARYAFDDITPGQYDVLNANGDVLQKVTVAATPMTVIIGGKEVTVDIPYGDFTIPMKDGGSPAVFTSSQWTPSQTGSGKADPAAGTITCNGTATGSTMSFSASAQLARADFTASNGVAGFSPFIAYEMDISSLVKLYLPGYSLQSGETEVSWFLTLTDKTTNRTDFIDGDSLKLSYSGEWGCDKSAQFKPVYKGAAPALLCKGHTYTVTLTASCSGVKDVTGANASAQFTATMKRLQVVYQAGTYPEIWQVDPVSGKSGNKITLAGIFNVPDDYSGLEVTFSGVKATKFVSKGTTTINGQTVQTLTVEVPKNVPKGPGALILNQTNKSYPPEGSSNPVRFTSS
ncbi:MAG: hypothetical protein C4536_09305 [Actinobacteria bacterium]|nr:MAG: hypothetical protein C4536_09305 [Actinomycetota bacterium]